MGGILKAVAKIVTTKSFTPQGFLISLAINFAISFVAKKLFSPKKSSSSSGGGSSFTSETRDRQFIIRSSVQHHRVVYGRAMLSGALVFVETTSSNKYVHLVLALAGHRVEEIERVLFNDVLSDDTRFSSTKKQLEKWKLTTASVSGANITATLQINGTNFTGTVAGSDAGLTSALVDAVITDITGDAGYGAENYTVSKLTETSDVQFTDGVVKGVIQINAKTAGSAVTVSGITGTWSQQVIQANISSSFATVTKHAGTVNQAADSTLVADVTKWTTAHRLRGLAYIITKLTGDQDKWPTGIPNIKTLTRGRKVYDSRVTGVSITASTAASPSVFHIPGINSNVDDHIFIRNHVGAVPAVFGEYVVNTVVDADHVRLVSLSDPATELVLTTLGTGGTATLMTWSDNWALCITDYICAWFGLKADEEEINFDDVTTEANICDEQVALTSTTETFTADNTSNTFTLASNAVDIRTGDIAHLSTTDTLPASLLAATNYYFINRSINDLREFQLATSLTNARAGTAIAITDDGTGTHTIEHKSQLRYTCNGVAEINKSPAAILEEMNTAGAGILPYASGLFRMFAGAFSSSALSLNEDDLRGGIDLIPTTTRRELFNAVRGTFSDPAKFYQPTSFPPVTNATYTTQDGEQIFEDIELAFTDQSIRAQRLAKIMLEKSRQGIVIKAPCKLKPLKITVGDVVDWTISELGFSAKDFRVVGWDLAEDGGVDLVCREDTSASYDWNLGDETTIDPAPNTDLPSPFDAPAEITGLTLASGTAQLLDSGDGNLLSRILVSWDAVTSQLVLNGGHILLSYKKSSETDWNDFVINDASVTSFYAAAGLVDGKEYDVRIKPVNSFGIGADNFTYVLNHPVAGKTAVPSDVTGFSASWDGNVVIFKWNQIADTDLAGYEIRFENQGVTYDHNNATPVTETTKGTTITTIAVMPGDWQFGIVAVDTSGNKSATPSTYNFTVGNSHTLLDQNIEHPDWLGTLTGLVKHWTGVLLVESQDLASDQGWETFDTYVSNPVATATYTALEQDVTFDDAVRLYGAIQYQPGPGESGTPQVNLQIDEKLDAGAYTGFENWTVGIKTGRYFKMQLTVDTSQPLPVITAFKPTIDKQQVTESKSVAVAAAGSTITFDNRFHNTPTLDVSVDSATALIPTYQTLTGQSFSGHIFNTSGADVGGTMNYTARGA